MCLLITGKSNVVRTTLLHTAGLIEDIFANNADGLGVMYGTSKGLKVCKTLPNSAAEVAVFLTKLPVDDREVAIHFRWRTHGDINLEQCHPYPVNATTALMHNGVLDQGNAADKTKSDTWHFIEDYMKTIHIDTLHDEGFTRLLGDFVGNNRFAIMSGDGRLTVVNKEQGIAHDGVWFSNTYAWEPSLLIPTYHKPVKPYHYSGFKSYPKQSWDMSGVTDDYDLMDEQYPMLTIDPDEDATFVIADDVDLALEESDSDTLQACLDEFPHETLRHVFDKYDVTIYDKASEDDLTPAVVAIRQELLRKDARTLTNKLEDDVMGVVSDRITQCLLWFCIVEPKMETIRGKWTTQGVAA